MNFTITLLHKYCKATQCELTRDGNYLRCEFKRSPRYWLPTISSLAQAQSRPAPNIDLINKVLVEKK